MTKGLVLVAAPIHQILRNGLLAIGFELIVKEDITQEEGYLLVAQCVGIITSTRLQIDTQMLDNAPNLKWIGRMGSGMEVIDVPYAESKGINCFGSPEGNCNSVAEHALGMLLALNKKIITASQEVKNGLWIREENRGIEIEGQTIGIIGFGHTGRAFAQKLLGFDVKILAYDTDRSVAIPAHVQRSSLQEIYTQATTVSFHVPQQADTIHYFDEAFIYKMQHNFTLINTSRGKVVDTPSLLKYLKTGKIKAACIDVLEYEPIKNMTEEYREIVMELSQMPQVIITPHIAGYSHDALFKMSEILLKRIVMLR